MPTLRCAECRKEARPDAQGWKAEIGEDPRSGEPPETFVFCPDCWGREFGEHHLAHRHDF